MKKNRIFIFCLAILFAIQISCNKDDSSEDENLETGGTVEDIDGNTYQTVRIGSQVWMVENLRTSKYLNGDLIPYVSEDNEWKGLTTGAYCNYNNDTNMGDKFGKLYNWHVVNDSRRIAPEGWHVPTVSDWETLMSYTESKIGPSITAAKTMAANVEWMKSDTIGAIGNDLSKNNSTGFSALPAGYRKHDGMYYRLSESTTWWSSDVLPESYLPTKGGRSVHLYNHISTTYKIGVRVGHDDFNQGSSIRCIKN